MIKNRIIITSPCLNANKNISGISTLTNFLINNNKSYNYSLFRLGKLDKEKRGILWFFRIIRAWFYWVFLMIWERDLLVHFNLALNKRSIIRDSPLILFARLQHKRMVIHLHGGEYLEKENAPKLIKTILRSVLSGKEPKIVLSLIEKELIIKKYLARNVIVLPNCINIQKAKEFNRIYPCEPPVKLLFIGRIVKDKGIEYILQALKTLKKRNFQFKFIMAGSGPEENDYVQKFSTVLGSDFEFKGIVSGEAKTELFKKCNVFLLPSLYEGLPFSLLECMSFGLVPIVTDVGSIKTIVRNGVNGIIVEKQSSEKISEAIENIISEKELMQRLGMNAQHYVFEHFDPNIYIEKLNEIYSNA